MRVEVRWTDAEGKPQKRDAKDWVRNTRTGKPLETDWVFAGSSFWRDEATGEEYYQADGGDLVCVSNFPTAMLDLPIASSQSNEALLFEVFDSRVDPESKELTAAIEKALEKAKPETASSKKTDSPSKD